MNKHHPPNDMIEKKLGQLPGADTDGLWNDMRSILDKKMPQKKTRRRFISWFLISKPFLLLITGFIIGIGASLFFLSRNDNSIATKTLSDTPQTSKIIEDGAASVNDATRTSITNKENTTTAPEPNQKVSNEVSITTTSLNTVGPVINKSSVILPSKKRPEEHPTDQTYQPILFMSKARPYFDITPVNLKSSYEDLLVGIEEKNPLNLEVPPVNAKSNAGRNNERGIYAGIISGIDLSSINFRSAKTGSTKGLIIGYAFNKKWSIESGLLWDTKRVFDDGKHFTPPGYTPSGGITIIAVNGKSRLYEWPVNVKYTILSGEHRLFTTAGLSSYFMRTENYDYEYLQNNQPGGHNYLSYKNETKNWFSVVNFSMGYSHKLGSLGSLRLEPYLKLPIKNIGAARMPVMSTGLNIGFTKIVR